MWDIRINRSDLWVIPVFQGLWVHYFNDNLNSFPWMYQSKCYEYYLKLYEYYLKSCYRFECLSAIESHMLYSMQAFHTLSVTMHFLQWKHSRISQDGLSLWIFIFLSNINLLMYFRVFSFTILLLCLTYFRQIIAVLLVFVLCKNSKVDVWVYNDIHTKLLSH